MEISLIYVFIIAEVILLLLGLCVTFAYLLLRKTKISDPSATVENTEAIQDGINLQTSYIDFLDQAMERNATKIQQHANADSGDQSQSNDDKASSTPNEEQASLLKAREQFLLVEKAATEQTEHEIHFWDHIYSGMQNLLGQLKTTEVITQTKPADIAKQKIESKEKVFYIETQGRKIDGEVNKLKDIIYDQENALSSMKKALSSAASELPDDSTSLDEISQQMESLGRQLNESMVCMEILEAENERLQTEINQMNTRNEALFDSDNTDDVKKPNRTLWSTLIR